MNEYTATSDCGDVEFRAALNGGPIPAEIREKMDQFCSDLSSGLAEGRTTKHTYTTCSSGVCVGELTMHGEPEWIGHAVYDAAEIIAKLAGEVEISETTPAFSDYGRV